MRMLTRNSAVPALAVSLSLALTACGATGGGTTLSIDPVDPCRKEREAFAGSKSYFSGGLKEGAKSIMKDTFSTVASVTGSVASSVAGSLGTTDAGSGSPYLRSIAAHAQSYSQVAQRMSADLAHESHAIDHSSQTFGQLRACRFAQAREVKREVRQGKIDRAAGATTIEFHQDRFKEELQVAHEYGVDMARRGQEYQDAAHALHRSSSSGGSSQASAGQVAAAERAASVSIPEKRASYDKTVATAEQNSKVAFNIDSTVNL